MQDCLERAIGRWRLRRRDASTRAWLLAMQRNLFLNDLRRRTRQGRHVELDEAHGHAAAEGCAERRLMARDALSALDDLSEDQRSLLLLVGVKDLSYAEAAAVFGVPEGTIMSRLSRARAQLRRLIEGGERMTLQRVK